MLQLEDRAFEAGTYFLSARISQAWTPGTGDIATSEQNTNLCSYSSESRRQTLHGEFSRDQGGSCKLTYMSPHRPNPIGTAWIQKEPMHPVEVF